MSIGRAQGGGLEIEAWVGTIRWEFHVDPEIMVEMSVCEALKRAELAPDATMRNRGAVVVALSLMVLLV